MQINMHRNMFDPKVGFISHESYELIYTVCRLNKKITYKLNNDN